MEQNDWAMVYLPLEKCLANSKFTINILMKIHLIVKGMDSLVTFHCFIINLIIQPLESFAYASNEETVHLVTISKNDLERDCGN